MEVKPITDEKVILVNERDEQVGELGKMEAHEQALLHRAFSVFIFNAKNEMLLQRRAAGKYHSPGLWTNACCSHPRPGEDTADAATRRLREELGFTTRLEKIFDFVYRSEFDNGLTEYEFDHVYAGTYDQEIHPNPVEVDGYAYRELSAIRADLAADPGKYTTWFQLAFPMVRDWAEKTP